MLQQIVRHVGIKVQLATWLQQTNKKYDNNEEPDPQPLETLKLVYPSIWNSC